MDLWASKPLAPQIQHDHPLARGLAFCVVPMSRSASFLDLCSGMRGAPTNVITTDAVRGNYGEGYNFGAASDRVAFADWARFDFTGVPGYSIAAWFRWSGTTTQFIVNKKASTAGNGWGLRVNTGGTFQIQHDAASIVSTGVVTTAVDAMVGAYWDGTNANTVLNGAYAGTAGAIAAPTASATTLRIGAQGANGAGSFGRFYGTMIWKRVLTRGEWAELYANPWAVVRPGGMELIRSMTEFYYAGKSPSVSGTAKPFITLGKTLLNSSVLGGK